MRVEESRLGFTIRQPPGQGTAETLHTLQTLLLRLIRHEDLLVRNQRVGTKVLLETFVEALTGSALAWEELIERPLIQKGRTKQDLANYFDMKTRYAKEYAVELLTKDASKNIKLTLGLPRSS